MGLRPVNLSLNEAQALAKKAAKGAGINWGAAHETGRAVRWLLEQGIDPFPGLLATLDAQLGWPEAELAPQRLGGELSGRHGILSGIMAGLSLADFGVQDQSSIQMQGVVGAELIAGFIALSLNSGEGCLMTDGVCSMKFSRNACQRDRPQSWRTEITLCASALPSDNKESFKRADILPVHLEKLEIFANRTYAPATEASRLAGAGSALSDND